MNKTNNASYRKLSRDEMKKVSGGVVQYTYMCFCENNGNLIGIRTVQCGEILNQCMDEAWEACQGVGGNDMTCLEPL